MENTENTKKNKARERSTPYPAITLETALKFTEQLKKALGKGPYSRVAIADALGHPKLTGPSIRKVAALSHYGLLSRKGDVYTLSPVTEDILYPVDELQKQQAITKAAQTPVLFARLVNQFNGQSVPARLDSILIREGIGSNAAGEVASLFKETLNFAGLLKNGIITSHAPLAESLPEENIAEDVQTLQQLQKSGHPAMPHKGNSFTDAGSGWMLSIQSNAPLAADVKKKLVDIADILENSNKAYEPERE